MTRPEAAAIGKPLDSVAVTFIQLIYGIIIMTFVAFGTLLFNLRPARGIERYAMFENIQRQLQRNFSEIKLISYGLNILIFSLKFYVFLKSIKAQKSV